MNVKTLSPAQALRPAFRKAKVSRAAIERMKHELPLLLDRTAGKVSESTLRGHLETFLHGVAFQINDYLIQSEVRRMDTVIHDGPKRKDPIGVIIEAKTTDNKGEMFLPAKPNVKALHELALYFMRERQAGNAAIKQLIITNGEAIYLFPDAEFERIFWNKKRFRKEVLDADADGGKNNPIVYEIIERHVADTDEELHCTSLHLEKFRLYCEDKDDGSDDHLLDLCKLLSPAHLLRRPFAGDSNHLDKGFYRELLHIIGLEEFVENSKGERSKKGSGKKVICRAEGANRHAASLLENTLQVAAKENRFRKVTGYKGYGSSDEDRQFAVGLELCLTWVNRVLFLKLLETQLVSYHDNAADYRFLTPRLIPDFDALNTLFFDVLNKPTNEREAIVAHFAKVPYLNSSLFEISPLEDQVLRVNSLKDQFALPLSDRSVLAGKDTPTSLPPLEYLFRFLDAYDFGGEGRASIQEDNKKLINASVLGLIFEKINGYRDGSFYTPGFITEYMCRETIRRAVVQKFRADMGVFASFDSDAYDDLKNYLGRDNYKGEFRTAANLLVNTVTICDPAVGSGHFLVSALNELIATKSDLGILGADAGAKTVGIKAEVANDELLLSDLRTGELYEYRVTTLAGGKLSVQAEVQAVQQTLFHEKRTLIENCLFGVDLNPNSVKICRLRLWIELLKSAYYQLPADGPASSPSLQTLPNIDINIKQGNSLISRFALDDDLGTALSDSGLTMDDYRQAVKDYHRASGSEEKQRLLTLIEEVKNNFSSHISRNDQRVKDLSKARGRMDEARINIAAAERFGIDDASAKKDRKTMAKQQAIVTKLETEITAVRDNLIYQNAFEWRFEFPAVLGADGGYLGFDVIVGNPPYISANELKKLVDEATYSFYKKSYVTSKGAVDIYIYFFEQGLKLLREEGYLCFLTPNRFLSAKYGKALREHLINNYKFIEIADYSNLSAFDEASTYTIASTFSKSTIADKKYVFYTKTALSKYEYSIAREYDSEILVSLNDYILGFLLSTKYDIIEGVINSSIPITNAAVINATSTASEAEEFNAFISNDRSGFKLINTGTIDEYSTTWGREMLTDKGQKFITPTLPRSLEVLGKNRFNLYSNPKIILAKIGIRAEAFYDQIGEYASINTNCLHTFTEGFDPKWIIGWINSKLYTYMFECFFDGLKMNGGYLLYSAPNIRNTYIYKESKNQTTEKISSIVTQILNQKQQDPTADTTALESEIDVLVYKLYGLTYAEVLVVDAGFGMGEEAYDKIEVV